MIFIKESKKLEILSVLMITLIGLLPFLMLSVGFTSKVFYLIIFTCLIICFSRAGGIWATIDDWFRYRWLAIYLFFMLALVLLVMVTERIFLGSALERSFRIAGGTFVVLGACLSSSR